MYDHLRMEMHCAISANFVLNGMPYRRPLISLNNSDIICLNKTIETKIILYLSKLIGKDKTSE